VYKDDVILMRPEVDASDKQIFSRNDFRTNADNLIKYLDDRGEGDDKYEIFRPKNLGEYGNPYMGTLTWMVENGLVRDPDFMLNYLFNKDKKLSVNKSKVHSISKKEMKEDYYVGPDEGIHPPSFPEISNTNWRTRQPAPDDGKSLTRSFGGNTTLSKSILLDQSRKNFIKQRA
jgi:hypothetical protein